MKRTKFISEPESESKSTTKMYFNIGYILILN